MKKILAFFASLLIFTASFAATPGTRGQTSTAEYSASVNFQPVVEISGLQDIFVSNDDWDSVNPFTTSSVNLCVYSNTSTHGYTIKATGTKSDGKMQDFDFAAINTTVPETKVYFGLQPKISTANQKNIVLKYDIASEVLKGSPIENCNSTSNLSLKFDAKYSDTGYAAIGGLYAATIDLTVSPATS